jgi:hypothetical protein
MQVEESPVWTNADTSSMIVGYLMSLGFNKSVVDPTNTITLLVTSA